MFASPKRLALGVALTVPGVVAAVVGPTAGAAPAGSSPDPTPSPTTTPTSGATAVTTTGSSGRNCVVTALSPSELAAGATPAVSCYPSFPDAMASVGMIVPRGTTAATAGSVVDAAAAANVLAIHYDGADGSGDSLTVTGADCTYSVPVVFGLLSGRISSTHLGICSKAKHYSGVQFAGDLEITSPNGSWATPLGALNDRVTSIRYA